MAKFNGLKLTLAGENLYARGISETLPLEITRVVVGDGFLPGILSKEQEEYEMTGVINAVFDVSKLNMRILADEIAQIEFDYTSNSFGIEFFFREIGIYAAHPVEGEVLYAYENVGEFADFMTAMPDTASIGATYMRRIVRILIKVASAERVHLNVIQSANDVFADNIGDGAGVYARRDIDDTLLFRRLKGSSALEVSAVGDTVVFSNTLEGENAGAQGAGLYAQKDGNKLKFKRLRTDMNTGLELTENDEAVILRQKDDGVITALIECVVENAYRLALMELGA